MSDRYLTIVYKYVSPERTAELTAHPDVSAMAHSHKMDEVNSLREKCEELQAKLNTAIDALDEANEGIARRQNQLDEAAKQEPVGRFCKSDGGTLYPEGIWTEVNELYSSEDCIPLFRHPPNLPALIEQARAEKQKPEIYVAAIHIRAAQENGECKTVIYGDDEHVHHVAPLYRHPPNLPALIEQARSEEREECAKLAEVCDDQESAARFIRARSGK